LPGFLLTLIPITLIRREAQKYLLGVQERGSDYYKSFIPPRSTDAPNGRIQEGKGIQRVKKKSEGEQGWGGLTGKEKKPLCDGGDIQSNRRGGQYTRRA
jgi:hypothetical protein